MLSRYASSDGLYLWRKFEEEKGTYGSGEDSSRPFNEGIVFPFLFLWANPELPAVKPSQLCRPLSHKFACGRIMMRTAWDEEKATFVSFTSGYDFHRGHNHPDQNSFTVCALGEDFLIDPGRISRDSQSHNLVMVNGVGQYDGCSRGKILRFEEHERYALVSGDATEAYIWNKETLIGYAVRHMAFIRVPHPMLVVRDDIQDEKNRDNMYEWMLHTAPENSLYQKNGAIYIRGAQNGALCRILPVWPQQPELVVKEEVGRSTWYANRECDLSQFFKEGTIFTRAQNPYFTVVITFGNTEFDMPRVTSTNTGENFQLSVEYPDGTLERFLVNREGISVLGTCSAKEKRVSKLECGGTSNN